MPHTVRVAALQFATGTDVEANLQTCLRMIDQAAQQQPDLMVLPEFCNHSSWYRDQQHCYEVAVDLDGDFLRQIAERAARHRCIIMINCTVRRQSPSVTGTNILFDRDGSRLAVSDKQVLMGNENNFLSRATHTCPIINLPFARVGMYSCMDGVIFETPRGLALRGAQILLNSLNSFADDEASLHVPVRAAENKVFIVAANKVGSLVPEELAAIIAQRVQIRPDQLHGAGESQIVAPDGTVLAKAPRTGEAVIVADIVPADADDKRRPDGTDIFASRRPELYAPLAAAPGERAYHAGAAQILAAVFQPQGDGSDALEEVLELLPDIRDVDLIVLPELFHLSQRTIRNQAWAVAESEMAIDALLNMLAELDSKTVVATSAVTVSQDGYAHTALLLGRDGVLLRQHQLHSTQHHSVWQNHFGSQLQTVDLPFGRAALVVGDDSIYPEIFRLLALQNVEIAIVPAHFSEAWETGTGLRERAAENRINIIAASRSGLAGSGIILGLDEDFTLWTPWKKRPFDGNINYPIVTQTRTGLTTAPIYPACAQNRMISQKTDVVDGRPYWLLAAITGSEHD
jgi:predicted amidohydrolase